MKKHTFHVSGTHCASCKILIEDTLNEQDFIGNARVDLKRRVLEVEASEGMDPRQLAGLITDKIRSNGYAALLDAPQGEKRENGLAWKAIPLGLGLLALFFLLQKSGVLNVGLGGQVTPVTSLIIGLVASVSSCLAVVGGLVLSLSANISKDGVGDTKAFLLFHGARLASFAVLGGVLGAVGGVIGINLTLAASLGILASLVMILLGLNLVGAFERGGLTMPSAVFNTLKGVEHKTFAPLALGFATFFLPCGFTQSMQVSALSSGTFISGLMIMLSFALGTLPVLALLSFGSASFARGRHAPLFFKSAGVVVIGLGLFALLSGLAGVGIINPIFNI